ncbi:MAG: AAA family ATPase [Gammaproteobacteria bacterium]|nr:AAA family ATPase [Gammaproteobacteria bacterium]MCW8911474.1 AAA family ATPase [Gammaproteobacteria bacterium]MCW9005282.1 AAA family ATPase [Gammaproteobacteria bacterium]
MYETFYGLKEKPFSMIPDPEYLFLSPKHQRALTLLEYGMMNQAGFSVICGDTGAGKTTLIRRLLNELGDDTTVGLITNTHQSFGELLNWVLMAFGIDSEEKSKAQMHQIFVTFLVEQYAQNKHTVLIVDEAQNMSADTLEELRMLSNINADKDQVLQVVLAGQPALRETLRKPELMQFAQRIAVDYYLEALNKEETSTYIKHRLKIAGAEKNIFTEDACAAIYQYSGGTPRLINLLSDTSLVYGFAEQKQTVDADIVNDVVREQHSHSVVPTYRKQQSINENTENVELKEQPYKVESQNNTDSTADKVSKIEEVVSRQYHESINSNNEIKTEDNYQETIDDERETNDHQRTENHLEATEIKVSEDEINSEEGGGKNDLEEVDLDSKEQEDRIEKDNNINYYNDSGSRANRRRDDLYPVIQVEEKSKPNINGLIVGFSGGMFLASILLVAFVFMYGVNTDVKSIEAANKIVQDDLIESSRQEVEVDQLRIIRKERDAALAVSKALERERDAALAAAKAQEEMRAAEMRAAEIIAEQERKAAKEVRRAKERARQAELDAIKSKERERLAMEKVELERLKAEKIKLEKEMSRIEAEKKNNPVVAPVVVRPVEESSVDTANQLSGQVTIKEDIEDKPKESGSKFIRNPCDSPSAKFLSTCKK